MTNATLGANAPAMPSRRTAFGFFSVAASAMFALPHVAAAADDSNLFAEIERVKDLLQVQEVALARLHSLNRRLPERPDFPALRARRDDEALFKTATAEGEPLTFKDIDAARSLLRMFRTLGIAEGDAVFGRAFARVEEIDRAENDFSHSWLSIQDTIGYAEVEDAFGNSVSAVDSAARALLVLRPQTAAGVRAVIAVTIQAELFDDDDGAALVQLLLNSPALGGEV